MARIRKRGGETHDYWPGFVDALATLLLVVVFLLALFIAAQFTLGRALSSRDVALDQARVQLAALADLLALEQAKGQLAQEEITRLLVTLEETNETAETQSARLAILQAQVEDGAVQLGAEQELNEKARNEVAALTAQLAALNLQLARLNTALAASEAKDAEQKIQIINMGKRLNAALARQVSQLAKYKSEFFAKLLEVLGDREGVRVEGDRFVFESDVLFASGSAQLNLAGVQQLTLIAQAIRDVASEIPSDLNWVIRVDGHTDVVPIRGRYANNWELSTARALSVVQFFEDAGVPPKHLVAAGFGQYHPLDNGSSAAALAKNRRIELKMDAR